MLALIGFGIHKQAYRAVAPPIYDPLGYIQKGKSVWSLVAQGDFLDILNAPPTSRPPGCVPFCYPFGYREDFRSFLFWSTFSPILLWSLSLFIALGRSPSAPGDSILPFAWILGLVSLPMFYHLEVSGTNHRPFIGQWGLQDCLLASVAAFATVTIAIGARRRLILLSLLGWSSAAYSLFIKPAGLLVMFAVAVIWLTEMAVSTLQTGLRSFREWWRQTRSYLLVTLAAGSAAFGSAVIAAVSSEYFAETNIQYAKTALAVVRSLYPSANLIPFLISYIGPVMGWWWFVILGISFVAALVCGIVRLVGKQFPPALLRPWAALVIILTSGCWWVFLIGFHARYYFPFLLIVIVWLLPDLITYLRMLSLKWRVAFATPPLLMTCALAVLLCSDWRAPRLESVLGVSLSSGGFLEEVQLGEQLMEEARTRNRPVRIYATASERTGVVFSVDYLNAFSSEQPPLLNFDFTLDWVREAGVRIEGILRSDYILFEEDERPPPQAVVQTYDQEISAYRDWLKSLSEQHGVSWVRKGSLSALRVRDPEQLRMAFREFISRHQWRDVFIQNNVNQSSPAVDGRTTR